MYNIVVITHEYDTIFKFDQNTSSRKNVFLLSYIIDELENRGYTIDVVCGVPKTSSRGDVAILHVDSTFTPAEYVDYARSFPFCINVGATDISKRTISGALLQKGQDWRGPVIVKSNLNFFGHPEARLNEKAKAAGRPLPFPVVRPLKNYRIYASLREVPRATFDDPNLVVEKFIPEEDPDGYALRVWVFCGDQGWCKRHISPDRMIKGPDVLRNEPVEVPEELRLHRKQLGLEFGKFDFVIHEGRPVLLDANKTVGTWGVKARAKAMAAALPHATEAERTEAAEKFVRGDAATLADGLESVIRDWVPRPKGAFSRGMQ